MSIRSSFVCKALFFVTLLGGTTSLTAQGAPALGAARSFAVLGASTVTSTGAMFLDGDLGVSPGTAITGFPPGVLTGTVHVGDALALQAQSDLTLVYDALAGAACTVVLTGQDLGGLTLTPGVYCFAASAPLNGALVLDGQGDPDALFVFQIGSTLLVELDSSVLLINAARADNVFWQVGSSATLAARSVFTGNVVALASITLSVDSSLTGRALARTGAVTMDTATVTVPEDNGCVASVIDVLPGCGFPTVPILTCAAPFMGQIAQIQLDSSATLTPGFLRLSPSGAPLASLEGSRASSSDLRLSS